jgi:hypothetical protein
VLKKTVESTHPDEADDTDEPNNGTGPRDCRPTGARRLFEYPLNLTVSPQQTHPMGDTPFRRGAYQRAGDWVRRGVIDGHSTAADTRTNGSVRVGGSSGMNSTDTHLVARYAPSAASIWLPTLG